MKRKEREPDIENRKVMSDDILEKNGWKDRYKRAYECIKPDEDSIDRIFEAEKGKTKKIELDEMVKNPDLKSVVPNLTAGILDRSAFPGCFGEKDERYGRQKCNVLNLTETSEALADDLTIIGVAYLDGILRIQVCEGDCTMADRHLNVYLLDEDGNKKLEDYAVGWKEEVNGVELKFTEVWFLVEEEELAHYQMYGTSNISDGLVEGDWAVTFRLEEG